MTLFHALGPFAAQAGVVAAPGMVLLTPTSIAHSGTSASIGANGQVTFTAVTSLSLNGVFSADFDNYVVSATYTVSTNVSIRYRMRASGSDDSGSNYTNQKLDASSTTVSASRATEAFGRINNGESGYSGFNWSVYGPNAAAPTAARSATIFSFGGDPIIIDYASTHSLSTSYDGFTIYPSSGNMTGKLQVYGVRS